MLLPLNCTVSYHPGFLSEQEAHNLYHLIFSDYGIDQYRFLLSDGSRSDSGKLMFIDEKHRAAGRFPEEAYGKNFFWPPAMQALRERVEAHTGRRFGTCVCIYYPDGNVGVDYHADFPAFGDTTVLPSLSLGAERLFALREKATGVIFKQPLAPGSMIVMGEHCQDRYEHSLLLDPKCKVGRINLTFREIGFSN